MIQSTVTQSHVKEVPVRLAKALIRRARAVYLQTDLLGSLRVCKRRVLAQLPATGRVRLMVCQDTVCFTVI